MQIVVPVWVRVRLSSPKTSPHRWDVSKTTPLRTHLPVYCAYTHTSDAQAWTRTLIISTADADAPGCATADFYGGRAASDADAGAAPTQSLCLPANFSGTLSLTTFLELSEAYTLCSDVEDVSPACTATRSAYYGALGCHFCGVTEQALLVGFRACLPFVGPEECAAAQPGGLDALPDSAAVSRSRVRTDEGAGREPAPKLVRTLLGNVASARVYRAPGYCLYCWCSSRPLKKKRCVRLPPWPSERGNFLCRRSAQNSCCLGLIYAQASCVEAHAIIGTTWMCERRSECWRHHV